jgi:hypothetical protein
VMGRFILITMKMNQNLQNKLYKCRRWSRESGVARARVEDAGAGVGTEGGRVRGTINSKRKMLI